MSNVRSIIYVMACSLYTFGFTALEMCLQRSGYSESVIALIACSHNIISTAVCAYYFYKFADGYVATLWSAGFITVGVADALHAVLHWVYPLSGLHVASILSSELYNIFVLLHLIAMYMTFASNKTEFGRILVSIVAATYFIITILCMTIPLLGTQHSLYYYLNVSDLLYNAIVALEIGMLIVAGLSTRCGPGLFFISAYILVFGSGFALDSMSYLGNLAPRLSIFNYGWELGFALIAVSLIWASKCKITVVNLFDNLPFNSLRFQIAALSLVIISVFILALRLIEVPRSFWANTDISIILCICLIAWTVANYAALWLYRKLRALEVLLNANVITQVPVQFEINNIINIYRDKNAKLTAIGNIATQVAHDIRSPLAALDVVVQHTAELPEESRLMIRSAVSRIRDIANGLLEKNRGLKRADAGEKAEASSDTSESVGIYLISSIIDPLVTEKRMQFRSRIGIEIDASIDSSSYGLFAKIVPTEFKRVISNLINNSVEALGERGAVSLSLSGSDKNIAIAVQDNGKGIPPEIVEKLGVRGETHGKAGGSGLGLYHARSSVESWGGKLEIASELGKGTSVAVTLPRAKPPDWFVSELKIEPSSTVVIADDDASIHQIWDGRFESIRANEKDIELLHFSTPEELSKWAGDRGGSGRKTIYLIDHEFIGDQRTGLDVIEHLNLGRKAILVTSRYEERTILDGCRKLGVRLIPKGMAGFVPMSIATAAADRDAPDLILIDDDDSIHITWRFSAKKNGKTIRAYSRPDDFFAEEKDFNRSLPIYVDANLGDDIHGDEIAKQIFDLGFTDVYLATGYQAKDFAHLTFLKGIQGKDPPW